MADYSQSKIYMLSSEIGEIRYYGSTTLSLKFTLQRHISYSKVRYSSASDVLKYIDRKITLVEDYPCDNKNELLLKEMEYIQSNKCCNKNLPVDLDENQRIYQKEYREKNKAERNKKIFCCCGGSYSLRNKVAHENTKKHNTLIKI